MKFGSPRSIHVDHGRCFLSSNFKDLAKKFNFKIEYSSPYHHQANGQIERQFRTIRDWIYCCVEDKLFRNWEECLPQIEFTINSTIHKSTKISPAEIIFGKRLSIDKFESSDKFLTNEDISNQMHNNTERSFEIGDKVWSKIDVRNKQEKRYDGPYTIIDKLHNRSYKIKKNDGTEIFRNIEWLTPYRTGEM